MNMSFLPWNDGAFGGKIRDAFQSIVELAPVKHELAQYFLRDLARGKGFTEADGFSASAQEEMWEALGRSKRARRRCFERFAALTPRRVPRATARTLGVPLAADGAGEWRHGTTQSVRRAVGRAVQYSSAAGRKGLGMAGGEVHLVATKLEGLIQAGLCTTS